MFGFTIPKNNTFNNYIFVVWQVFRIIEKRKKLKIKT